MDEVTTTQIAANRAALYRWFAMAFFAQPTENDVVDMREGKAQRLLSTMAGTPGASLGVQTIAEVLTSGTLAEVTSALGTAHAKLFFGVGGFETASPYRSIYTSDRGVLCQQATAEMERVLRQHRLQLEDSVCEPSDHLCIQLEVMAQLALRYVEATQLRQDTLASLQSEQAEFLNTQLLSWLPAFTQRLVEVDSLGFHAGLASVLQAVLEQDHAYLVDA